MANGDNVQLRIRTSHFLIWGYKQFIILMRNIKAFEPQQPSDAEDSTIHVGVAGSPSIIFEADVPKFDLGFVLSSSDEEIEFNPDDSIADMFI